MNFLLTFLAGGLGLIVGSFLNVVILRLEKGETIMGRSYCPHCKHQLGWLELVPVLSFLVQGGKCRHCGAKISWQYPAVEMLTALVFAISAISLWPAPWLYLIVMLYVASSLIVIFVYDFYHYIIPDVVLFPAIFVLGVYRLAAWLLHGDFLFNYLGAAALAAGFFLVIFLVSGGRWIGFGDVKLAILLGLLLGFPAILAGLWLSFLLGALVGIMVILFKGKGVKSEMPFAPFLILGTAVALVWGSQLIAWYNSFLFI